MQLKSNKMYPHPILWEENDDYIENKAFSLDVSYDTNPKNTTIILNINLLNEEMVLLLNDRAKIIAHLECPAVKYRKSFEMNLGNNEITIPSNELNGKVEIVCVIQNIVELDKYSNKKFNALFNDLTFDIPEYSILAISPQFTIQIEKENNDLNSVSSIVSIIPDEENNKCMTVFCENKNKIYIKLPQKAYFHYSSLSMNKNFNEIIFSMVIIPGLMQVFNYLLLQEDLDVFDDYRWFIGLSKKIKEIEKKELTIDFLKKSDLFKLSQRILENPVNDSFEFLVSNK